MSTTDRDRVAQKLPPYGAHVLAEGFVKVTGLPEARAWAALAVLCCEGVATVRDGWVTRGRDTAGMARRKAA